LSGISFLEGVSVDWWSAALREGFPEGVSV